MSVIYRDYLIIYIPEEDKVQPSNDMHLNNRKMYING